MMDEIESGESASAKRYAVKCTGITQNAVAYPVTEIALVSGRGEMRGENKRSMIALGEPEGMNSGRCAKDLRTSGSQCGGGRWWVAHVSSASVIRAWMRASSLHEQARKKYVNLFLM